MKSVLNQSIILLFLLVFNQASAQRAAVPVLDTSTPYLIHYGNWTSTLVEQARDNYSLVILHPSVSNITAADIATIRSGPDMILGNIDDVKVLAYISLGEDDRPGAPFVGDGSGPRIDPRASYSDPLEDSIDPLGDASTGGTGYAAYYLDDEDFDGFPDQNTTFGGYFVNPGDPAWLTVLTTQTIATDGRAGTEELLTTTSGAGYGCDGLFLDTLDTPAPNSFGATQYEWTTKAYRDLVKDIGDLYPSKLLLANRGVFFYNPNLKSYAYTLRPYINLLMFESYYTDSSESGMATAFFDDNKFNFAPKINAEANRSDGFTVVSLGYKTTGESAALIEQDYVESQQEQGWLLYRTNPLINEIPFNTGAATWNVSNPDVSAPVWDSTAAASADSDPATPGNQAPAPRVGIQEAENADQQVTVRWDIARDQTGPVTYNIYYTSGASLDFSTATLIAGVTGEVPAAYTLGTGENTFANEYTVTGLTNDTSYIFAVRAVDSLGNEDGNTETISATAGEDVIDSFYKTMVIDGDFADWDEVPVSVTDASSGSAIDYQNVQVANDDDYLYVRFTLHSAATAFGSSSSHLFIDTDNDAATGYAASSGFLGSEMMVELGIGYDQRGGGFNEGGVTALDWSISPSGSSATSFELRVSRSATFTTGGASVFAQGLIQLLLQDNGGDLTSAIPYQLAEAPVEVGDSYYAPITVDGDDADWAGIPVAYEDVIGDGTPDIASIQVANDDDYLYLLVRYSNAVDTNTFNGSPSIFLSLDNDADTGTGYNIGGQGVVGADVTWQNDFAFSQSAASFNTSGTFTDAVPTISPYQANTSFQEYRIPRSASYSVGGGTATNVFPELEIKLMMWSDDAVSPEFAGSADYTFAANPGVTLYEQWKYDTFSYSESLDELISGDDTDSDGDGLNTFLEYALGGNPFVADEDKLPTAEVVDISAQSFLELTYLRRAGATDINYVPQVSMDLISWDDNSALYELVSTTPAETGYEYVTIRLIAPVGSIPTFFRLEVITAP